MKTVVFSLSIHDLLKKGWGVLTPDFLDIIWGRIEFMATRVSSWLSEISPLRCLPITNCDFKGDARSLDCKIRNGDEF